MSNQENELQEKLESGQSMPDTLDARLYQQLFKSLAERPEFTLSDHFASDIVARVQHQQSGANTREHFWLVFGVVSLVICLMIVVSLNMSTLTINTGFLSAVKDYKGVFVFGIAVVYILHWVDKRFVRSKQTTA